MVNSKNGAVFLIIVYLPGKLEEFRSRVVKGLR